MPEKRITVWAQRFKDRKTLVLQWLDPVSGKRISKTSGTGDEKEAEARRADLEYELNNGKYQEVSKMGWERFRELFEDEYVAPLREDTRTVYANVFNLFEKVCNPKQLRSINERTVSAFAAGLRKLPGRSVENMMPSTIKARLQFLHTALKWAADQKLIPECPKFPSTKVPRKKPQPVPAESFERIIAKAPDAHMEAFLLAGWLAGLRLKEALALEWEASVKAPWVDFARNRIVMPAEFVKAVEDQWLPLDPALRQALEALPRTGKKVFRFVDQRGRVLTKSGVSLRVVNLARKAGVRLSMHTLRKGFGCRYAGKVSAQVLQRLMRHSSIQTTMDYYANVDDAVEEAILGPQCNGLRNKPSPASQEVNEEMDLN